jgi:hypothetical protein
MLDTADDRDSYCIMGALVGIDEETELVYETLTNKIKDSSFSYSSFAFDLLTDLAIKNPEYIPGVFELRNLTVGDIVYDNDGMIVNILSAHYVPVNTVLSYLDLSDPVSPDSGLTDILENIGENNSAYIPEIIALLERDNTVLFNAACDALAGIGDPAIDAVPILEKFYLDSDPAIAEKARWASEQIMPESVEIGILPAE